MDFAFGAILPEIILVAAGLLLLLLEAVLDEKQRGPIFVTALLGVALALVSVAYNPWVPAVAPGEHIPVLGGSVTLDGFGHYFRVVLLAVAILVILTGSRYVRNFSMPDGEFYALLLFSISGGMFMAIAGDLLTFYVGLELLSIPSYIMAGLLRRDDASNEASLKYFLNGATASAVLLFGLSLLFGMTGSTSLADMAGRLSDQVNVLTLTGLVMVIGGIGFKIAAVPFHLWVPDVYQGSPTPVTAFLSVGSKGAAFAAVLRLFFVAFGGLQAAWAPFLAGLAVLTMTVANITALQQTNIKRMLAYSSVTHAGYILAGVATGTSLGFSAVMYYVLAYVFMNVGAFAVVIALENRGEGQEIAGFAGLMRRSPVLAVVFLLFLLSLIGIPPTAGFFAKFYVIRAAVQAGMAWLAVAIVLNSAISVGYYYGVVHAMFVRAPEKEEPVGVSPALSTGLALAVVGVVVLGFLPELFVEWVNLASLVMK